MIEIQKKQRIILKSSKQEVTEMTWSGQDKKPWPDGYHRVLRKFVGNEGSRQGLKAEVMIVHKTNLLFDRI